MEKINTTRIFSIIAAVFYGLIALSCIIIAIHNHGDVSFVFITYCKPFFLSIPFMLRPAETVLLSLLFTVFMLWRFLE